jgi:mRNA interferase RelE/StbE
MTAAIEVLAVDPRHAGAQRLAGRRDRYRVRVGSWRVLYAIDDTAREVIIHNIKHRREAYR